MTDATWLVERLREVSRAYADEYCAKTDCLHCDVVRTTGEAAAEIERQAQETARWIEHAKFQCQAKLDALRRVDVLQEALREQTVDRTGEYGRCVLCESLWRFKDTERHAEGCLASPAETKGDDRG